MATETWIWSSRVSLARAPSSTWATVRASSPTKQRLEARREPRPGAQAGFNMVADVNGDGIPDIEILGANTIAVYLGEGGATRSEERRVGKECRSRWSP